MRNLFFVILLSLTLGSCVQSKEDKAESLIKESLSKTQIDMSAYTPISTKVSEAYNIPLNNATCQGIALQIVNLEKELWAGNNTTGSAEYVIRMVKGNLQDTIANLDTQKRLGYEIKHQYQIKSANGNVETQSVRIIADDNFKEILFVDPDHPDFDHAKSIINQLVELNKQGEHY